ncbi:MAG TPA: protoporphyrinogen oxidase [Trebonia sp.]|jgi:oxygen-dependent protoporphyrinogen oxidase|nr:protoporphyrinogen oxidase [Trebonia sp.]
MADRTQDQASTAPHVVIVGGGIAGLAAAFSLRDEPVRVTVLEAAGRIGGKLVSANVAGVRVDLAAESTYAPRAKGTGLLAAAGLEDQLAKVGVHARALWSRAAMRPLPPQILGVPWDLDALAASGVVSDAGMARAREDLARPATELDEDTSVAAYVAGRMGQEVVDRITDPFLCGVYGGRAAELSIKATMPPLAAAARKYPSLAEASHSLVKKPLRPGDPPPPPGVTTLLGGMGSLPQALADAVLAASAGASVRTGAGVRALARTAAGWRLTVGPASDPEYISADAVILALPAGPASRLLAGTGEAAAAAAELAGISYGSLAGVTLAYRRDAFAGGLTERGSCGYLVPAADGKVVTEVIFSTVKWPHLAGEVEIMQCQIGRTGDEAVLQRDDADLAAIAAAEAGEANGAASAPVATLVTRFDTGHPQYSVGHLARVARIRASVAAAPGLAVCGAAYDGVGVATCVASAAKAVKQVTSHLFPGAEADAAA